MKAKVIKKTCDELTRLLNEPIQFTPDFPKDGKTKLSNIPISPPKAYILTILACKKFSCEVPKVSFVSPSDKSNNGFVFSDVKRIFLVRHDTETFIKKLSEYINPIRDDIFNQISSIWEERENGTWI